MFAIEDDAGTRVVTDPYDSGIGYVFPVLEASVVLVSHEHYDHSNIQALKGAPEVIQSEGYSTSHGLAFEGLPSAHDTREGQERGPNVIFRWSMGGLSFAHLGDLGHKLDKGLLERLTALDVLFIPVGGFYTVDDEDRRGYRQPTCTTSCGTHAFQDTRRSHPQHQGGRRFHRTFHWRHRNRHELRLS